MLLRKALNDFINTIQVRDMMFKERKNYIKRISIFSFAILLGLAAQANQNQMTHYFAFMKEDLKSKEIILQDNLGQNVFRTDNKFWSLYPDISANGKYLTYIQGENENKLSIKVVRLQDQKEWTVNSPFAGSVLHPKISKNLKFLFFSAKNAANLNQIYYFDFSDLITNKEPQIKSLNEDEAYFPRPSSDANFIVYQKNSKIKNPIKREIIFLDRIQNKKTVIAEGMSPNLSPDETQILYTKKVDGEYKIFSFHRITKEHKQLTNFPGDQLAPVMDNLHNLYFSSKKVLLDNVNLHQDDAFKIYKLNLVDKALSVYQANIGASLYSMQISGELHYAQASYAKMSGEARSSFATAKWNDRVYVCGGHQGPEHTYPEESFTNRCSYLDLDTNTWHEVSSRPALAHGYQMIAYKDYLYAFGGFAFSGEHKPKWKSLDFIDRYDIINDKWERIGKLNLPRSSNQAVLVNDKVYILGGWNATPRFLNDYDGSFHDSIEIFDLKTESISIAKEKLVKPLRRAFTAFANGEKIYLLGGLGESASHFSLLDHMTILDSKTMQFSEGPKLAFATFAPGAGVIANEIYIFGGMFKTGEWDYEYVSHVYAFNMQTQQWRHTSRYLSETKGFSQVVGLENNSLLILGGHHYFENADHPVQTVEVWHSSLAPMD